MQPISSSSPTAISFQTYEKVKIGCALEFFFPCSTVSKHTEVFIQYRFFPTFRSVWPKERLPSRSSYQSKILNCSKYNSQQQQDSKSHKIYLIWYILKKKCPCGLSTQRKLPFKISDFAFLTYLLGSQIL